MALLPGIRWWVAQKLELRWWKHYLRRQTPAEYLQKKRAYWHRVLKETQWTPRAGDRILDAGCGPAGIFLILDQYRVDACDPLIDAYAHHLRHFRPTQYPWVQFYSQAMEAGFPNPPYDFVCCTNAINHVRDMNLALRRLTEAMKPGSRMLLSSDVHRWTWIKYIFRWLPGDVLHPHQYDLADLCRQLQQHGLEIVQTQSLKKGLLFDYQFICAQWQSVGVFHEGEGI